MKKKMAGTSLTLESSETASWISFFRISLAFSELAFALFSCFESIFGEFNQDLFRENNLNKEDLFPFRRTRAMDGL
jgi:hypothetical protein